MRTSRASLRDPFSTFILLSDLIVLSALLAMPAYAGVRRGQRREDEIALLAGGLADDDSQFGRG